MHSTSTIYAGLPLVFKQVRRLNLDRIIENIGIRNRKIPPAKLALLIVALKIVGITRLSHIHQIGDFLISSLLGFEALPDQSTVNRFLGKINRTQAQKLFSLATEEMIKSGKVEGKVLAADVHVIPYYGEKQPLATKTYCATKNRAIPGFKLICIYDVKSGFMLAYRFLPGNADCKKVLTRMLSGVISLLPRVKSRYILIDKGFHDKKVFAKLKETRIYFVIPAKRYASIRHSLFALSDDLKDDLVFGSNVVETVYQPKGSKLKLRLIFKFFPKEKGGGDGLFDFLTNDDRVKAESLLKLYSKRWRLENAFAELKNDFFIDKLPSSSFEKINAHIALTLIAYNLSILVKSCLKKLAKVRMSTLRRVLIKIQAAIKIAAGLVYVDAVFKEHLPKGRIRCGPLAAIPHLSEVIYC